MEMEGTWFVKKEISGGGVLMDNGPHVADLISYLFGEVTAVKASAADIKGVGVEDTAKIEFTLNSGIPVTADMTWAAWVTPKHYLEIYGEEGTLFLDTEGITMKYKTWADWKRMPHAGGPSKGFADQINHFVNGIQSRQTLLVAPEAGLAAQRVITAAYRSLANGGSAQPV